MILYLTFEEISALGSSAELVLASATHGGGVSAPPQFTAELEQFSHALTGDIAIETIEEQRRMARIVDHLLAVTRSQLDQAVLEQHAAAEEAVAAYFAYAHVLTVSRRLRAIGTEMSAIVEVITGDDPDSDQARRFSFPE